jgi:hypothetical protein
MFSIFLFQNPLLPRSFFSFCGCFRGGGKSFPLIFFPHVFFSLPLPLWVLRIYLLLGCSSRWLGLLRLVLVSSIDVVFVVGRCAVMRSSSLSLCLSRFLGFIFFLGVVLSGWVFSGSFWSLLSMLFSWLAAALSCVGFGSFASWVVDLLCLGPPTSACASLEVSPSWSSFPRRWRCCGWTPRAVPVRMAEGVF